MTKLSKKEFKDLYGIDLPSGKYFIEDKDSEFKVSTFKDDTDGCLLLGKKKTKNSIIESKVAVKEFEKWLLSTMKKEKVFIKITK